jgi:hypothetical protein
MTNTKLCTMDYVTKISKCAKDVYIRFNGDVPRLEREIRSHALLYVLFFKISLRHTRRSNRMMLDVSSRVGVLTHEFHLK